MADLVVPQESSASTISLMSAVPGPTALVPQDSVIRELQLNVCNYV